MVTLDFTSTDDLFTLTAALSNGDHCKVLSNDYYRQYYHLIGETVMQKTTFDKLMISARDRPELAKAFYHWQASHQIRIDSFQGYHKARTAEEVTHCDPRYHEYYIPSTGDVMSSLARFVWPQPHSPQAQVTPQTGHWHLPIM